MTKFEIKNRWTGAVIFEAELSAEYEKSDDGVKLGASIKLALKARADLTGSDLSRAVLTGADLRRAVLTGSDLTGADLTAVDLSRAVLTGSDLTGADLTGADLRRAVLRRADLTAVDLSRAVLTGSDLTGADLTGADLRRADLRRASLTGSDLSRAVLTDADLTGSDLTGADLSRADLTGADLESLAAAALRSIRTDFFDVLLRARSEVPALLCALREGRIDGSTYSGECACLAGTIANTRHCSVDDLGFADSHRPIERWFMAIRPGNKPDNHAVAKMIETWILEFMAIAGIEEGVVA